MMQRNLLFPRKASEQHCHNQDKKTQDDQIHGQKQVQTFCNTKCRQDPTALP